jgi:hypothetical protein
MKRAVVRLPSEVVVRLDLLAQKLRAAHPERTVSRAAVVRALVGSALAVAESEPAPRPEPEGAAGDAEDWGSGEPLATACVIESGVAGLGDAGRGRDEPS